MDCPGPLAPQNDVDMVDTTTAPALPPVSRLERAISRHKGKDRALRTMGLHIRRSFRRHPDRMDEVLPVLRAVPVSVWHHHDDRLFTATAESAHSAMFPAAEKYHQWTRVYFVFKATYVKLRVMSSGGRLRRPFVRLPAYSAEEIYKDVVDNALLGEDHVVEGAGEGEVGVELAVPAVVADTVRVKAEDEDMSSVTELAIPAALINNAKETPFEKWARQHHHVPGSDENLARLFLKLKKADLEKLRVETKRAGEEARRAAEERKRVADEAKRAAAAAAEEAKRAREHLARLRSSVTEEMVNERRAALERPLVHRPRRYEVGTDSPFLDAMRRVEKLAEEKRLAEEE